MWGIIWSWLRSNYLGIWEISSIFFGYPWFISRLSYMIVSNHGQKLGLAPSGLGMGIVAMWVVWETQMALIWTMKSGSCVGFTTLHPPTIKRWETNLTLISYRFLWFHAVNDQFHGPFWTQVRSASWLVSCFITWTEAGKHYLPSMV